MSYEKLMQHKASSGKVDKVLNEFDLTQVNGLKEYVMKKLAASGVTDGLRVTHEMVKRF